MPKTDNTLLSTAPVKSRSEDIERAFGLGNAQVGAARDFIRSALTPSTSPLANLLSGITGGLLLRKADREARAAGIRADALRQSQERRVQQSFDLKRQLLKTKQAREIELRGVLAKIPNAKDDAERARLLSSAFALGGDAQKAAQFGSLAQTLLQNKGKEGGLFSGIATPGVSANPFMNAGSGRSRSSSGGTTVAPISSLEQRKKFVAALNSVPTLTEEQLDRAKSILGGDDPSKMSVANRGLLLEAQRKTKISIPDYVKGGEDFTFGKTFLQNGRRWAVVDKNHAIPQEAFDRIIKEDPAFFSQQSLAPGDDLPDKTATNGVELEQMFKDRQKAEIDRQTALQLAEEARKEALLRIPEEQRRSIEIARAAQTAEQRVPAVQATQDQSADALGELSSIGADSVGSLQLPPRSDATTSIPGIPGRIPVDPRVAASQAIDSFREFATFGGDGVTTKSFESLDEIDLFGMGGTGGRRQPARQELGSTRTIDRSNRFAEPRMDAGDPSFANQIEPGPAIPRLGTTSTVDMSNRFAEPALDAGDPSFANQIPGPPRSDPRIGIPQPTVGPGATSTIDTSNRFAEPAMDAGDPRFADQIEPGAGPSLGPPRPPFDQGLSGQSPQAASIAQAALMRQEAEAARQARVNVMLEAQRQAGQPQRQPTTSTVDRSNRFAEPRMDAGDPTFANQVEPGTGRDDLEFRAQQAGISERLKEILFGTGIQSGQRFGGNRFGGGRFGGNEFGASAPARFPEPVGVTPEGRQIFRNPDGERFSEKSVTVQDPRINGGRWTNIPTVFHGSEVSQEQAIQIIARNRGFDPETGMRLDPFPTLQDAVRAAKAKSEGLR